MDCLEIAEAMIPSGNQGDACTQCHNVLATIETETDTAEQSSLLLYNKQENMGCPEILGDINNLVMVYIIFLKRNLWTYLCVNIFLKLWGI